MDFKDLIPVFQALTVGLFALFGVLYTQRKTREREDFTRRFAERALLQSLKAEMTNSLEIYRESIGGTIERSIPNGELLTWFLYRDNPFPVFSSCCGSLGLITDEKHRRLIVKCHFGAYAMLDGIRYNSELIRKRDRQRPTEDKENVRQEIRQLFPDLKKGHESLMALIPETITRLDKALPPDAA